MSAVLSATATTGLEREHHRAEAVVETMLTIADGLEQGRRIDNSLLTEVLPLPPSVVACVCGLALGEIR